MTNIQDFVKWRFPCQYSEYEGTLILDSNNKGTLTLYGSAILGLAYSDYKKSLEDEQNHVYDFVLGKTLDSSKLITVKGFLVRRSGFDVVEIEFDVINCFIGEHIVNDEQIIFDEFIVEYSYFDKWLGVLGYNNSDFNGYISRGWENSTKFVMEYTSRKVIEIQINDELIIQIQKIPEINHDLISSEEIIWHTYVKFISKGKDFDYFQSVINQFNDFLNFFITQYDVKILKIIGKMNILYKHTYYYKRLITIKIPFHSSEGFNKLKVIKPFLIHGLNIDLINITRMWFELKKITNLLTIYSLELCIIPKCIWKTNLLVYFHLLKFLQPLD